MQQQAKPLETKSKVSTRADLSTRLPPVGNDTLRLGGKKGIDESTYSAATSTAFVKSGFDVPIRHHEPRVGDVTHGTFTSKSTLQESAHSGVGESDPSFYSRARMEERRDDEVRHGQDTVPSRSGAGRMQRTVDIMRKREQDPKLAPPAQVFENIDRRTQNGVPLPTRLETVRFTYTMPKSSQQMEYKSPTAYYPPELDQEFATQRSVMSQCAASKDLFVATTKVRHDVVPGYMSHIPSDSNILNGLSGESDTLRQYARAGHMTAAKPGSIAAPVRTRNTQSLASTTQGQFQLQAVSFPAERELNRVKGGKKSAPLN